ncbi:MAG: transglycosylase SLT domain-containing protein [Arcobacteraceae bacterium]
MKKLLLLLALFSTSIILADEFADFKKQEEANYSKYQQTIEEEFNQYQTAHDEAFKEFSKQLGKKWPQKNQQADISTKKKFVEYSADLNSKKVIDYSKNNISLEVIAKTQVEAKKKIENMFNSLLKENVKDAYKNDILENNIAKKLKKTRPVVQSKEKLVSDVITPQEKLEMINKLKKQNLIMVKYKGNFIYKANVKMPSDTMIRKAKTFKSDVLKNANSQKIPAELIYAIMHSESSFNPMARSHIPAFGLMQIVPRSAGIDSYQYLYNKKRVLSSAYLYNSTKNITIGSGYLHVLYYRYLKNIKNPQSRLYCAIAAYNTGAGNVAKTFIGNTNINKAANTINEMTPDQVYKKLISNLPYNETRTYLKKVNDRVSAYNKLLKTTI